MRPALLCGPAFHLKAATIYFGERGNQRAMAKIDPKDLPHLLGLCLIDHQACLTRVCVVAEHRISTNPLAFAPGRGLLVARALADDFALKLCKRQQHVERETTHRAAAVELLRNRNEADASLVEHLHDTSEVQQGTAEPVDLV